MIEISNKEIAMLLSDCFLKHDVEYISTSNIDLVSETSNRKTLCSTCISNVILGKFLSKLNVRF